MATALKNFTFHKGEDVAIDWTILDTEGGDPENIAGWTFSLKIKRNASDSDPASATGTTSITDAANGLAQTTIAAAVTVLLEGDYAYSFWRTNAGSAAVHSKGTMSFIDTTEN